MPFLQDTYLFTLVDRSYYEPLDCHATRTADYADLLRRRLPASWRIHRESIWCHCTPPVSDTPAQGWKIHISTTVQESSQLLAATIPVLTTAAVPFKVAADRFICALLMSKTWPRGGAGKFMTVYPRSNEECHALLNDLSRQLEGFVGPLILSDRRYGTSRVVHYRYGGIHPRKQLRSDGSLANVMAAPSGAMVEDHRLAFFVMPPGITDPFAPPPPNDGDKADAFTLKNGRYQIDAAITFSSAGGVYQATDRQTGKKVVIKEARPHTGQTSGLWDAVSLLRKEYRLLTLLADEHVAPQPIDFFQDWEHHYLVEEFLDGAILRGFTSRWRYALRVDPSLDDAQGFLSGFRAVFRHLAHALRAIHRHGVVFGDLSPQNVMVLGDGLDVRLIDLEGAIEQGVDAPTLLYTPGYAPQQVIAEGTATFADDRFGLGALMLGAIMPINEVMALGATAAEPFLASFVRDLGVPRPLADCIRRLISVDRDSRPELEEVIAVLEAEDAAGPPTVGATELSSTDMAALLEGIAHHATASMTPARRDRLYPAAPAVFNTNPLGLAYGACGTAYALSQLSSRVDSTALDWILGHEVTEERYPPGLFAGMAGIAWALLALGARKDATLLAQRSIRHPLTLASPDLYHGAAGVGLVQLHFFRVTSDEEYLRNACLLGDHLLSTGTEHGASRWWLVDGVEHSGLGHGSCGIALFLLRLFEATQDHRYLAAGLAALDHVMDRSVQHDDGVTTWKIQEDQPTVTPYWRWGSAGIGCVLLRYRAALATSRFDATLDGILRDTDRKYSVFAGLHTGLAGMAEFLLDAAAFGFAPERAAAAARKVLSGVLLFKVERPDGIAFPGESRSRLTCDLATGSAGIGLVLCRLVGGKSSTGSLFLDPVAHTGSYTHRKPGAAHQAPGRPNCLTQAG
ncbi:MAG: class III lanthionine synthetase LanKC [Gemmatimonadales bacterium]|nr:class III lanthionine synthetase LanKC [Gemmatimonadales bacterium]